MIKVKAKAGLLVPKEHSAREYIDDKEVTGVENTLYYRKAIQGGDLIVQKQTGSKKKEGDQ